MVQRLFVAFLMPANVCTHRAVRGVLAWCRRAGGDLGEGIVVR